MNVQELIFNDPLYSAILVIVLAVVGFLSRLYVGPEDDWVEAYKRKWAIRLDPYVAQVWRPLLIQKHVGQYVATVDIDPDALERIAHQAGYIENDISNVKFRILPDGTRQYTVGQMKISEPNSARQWHLFIFPGHDGAGTDLYQHGETDWDPSEGGSPEAHLTQPQVSGDPERVLRNALESQELPYHRDEEFAGTMKEHGN